MARALRSGHGLTMAFQTVADELPAPVSEEFQQVCDELKFGNSFHDALSKMPERINSSDLSFFVLGILIQRETGGNLSDLLNSLSSTVRDRLKLHGKVRTLAAEGKFSGILLGTLPFALALIMTFLNPTYMGNLWFTPVGHKWLTIGSVMLLLGFAWMWKIAQIKV
jgi:tight adherence protein B